MTHIIGGKSLPHTCRRFLYNTRPMNVIRLRKLACVGTCVLVALNEDHEPAGELGVYSSTLAAAWRRRWLMEDRQYRLGVVAGSIGDYREPQRSTTLQVAARRK